MLRGLWIVLIIVQLSLISLSVECNAAERETRSSAVPIEDIVLRVARRQLRPIEDGDYRQGPYEEGVKNRQPRGVTWDYSWGVTLYGLLRVSEVTNDATFRDFVVRHNEVAARFYRYLRWREAAYGADVKALRDALDRHAWDDLRRNPLSELMLLDRLDFCGAMGAQMLETFLRQGAQASPEEEELLEVVADYIVDKQPRLSDGTFWRTVVLTPFDNKLDRSLWIDDLYMSCPFLARWSQYKGEEKHLNDAARQVIQMAARQQDKDGLWFHGNLMAEGAVPPFKWGRGNGWAMVATVEVLSAMPEDHPQREALLVILRRHVAGVVPLQAPSGLWRQLLDREELWEETSCSAMFAYSIARAVNRGWISADHLHAARGAFAGISRRVTEDGQVNGTCEGTEIGRDAAYYAGRRRPPNDIHGIGAVLLAGTELMASHLRQNDLKAAGN
jgi:unsaturated rhamnogalacturonyl hydrolase